ncbi:MAG: type II secretion system inner membrane protein GspF [Deltaproteobacteria bacterium]|nr:type II secretion system inner membrane protein GspF [Deltaproteobacteria bacterium]
MATYSYKAADSTGKILTGVLDADTEKKVVTELQTRGLIPMRITLARGNGKALGLNLSGQLLSLFNGVSSKDVMVFTQDLATLLEAGLPVDRALSLLIESADKERFKKVVGDILKTVQGGGYLSDALAKHPRAFTSFYVSMVRAGEAGGVLEAVLSRLGEFLESAQELKDYIKSAMVYPIFLVSVGGLSIIILLTFVIPKFSIIFSDMGQALPLSTQVLLGISHLLQSYWWAILLILGAGYFFLRKYLKTPSGRLKFDRKKMKFPFVGELVKKIEVARFARTLGTLTKSGVPILQALMLVKDILGNKVVSNAMEKVYARVKEGDRLSKPLRDTGIFPPLAIQMITVGEETGRLDSMLLRVAESYEKMVRNMVKRLISLLEPAMILLMGLVVGFVVVSMLMAVFSMNEMPF